MRVDEAGPRFSGLFAPHEVIPVQPLYRPRKRGFAALTELDSIPWGNLQHAYGKGVTGDGLHHDVAASLELIAEDWSTAIDALYANICHQGTVYEATAWAVPFLAAVAAGDIDDDARVELVALIAKVALASSEISEDGTQAGSYGPDVALRIREALQHAGENLQRVADHDDAVSPVVEAIAAISTSPDEERREQLEDAVSDLLYTEDDDAEPTPEELASIRQRRADGERTLARLQVGSVVLGRVKSLTDYAAFIDLGGVDGLLHVLDMGVKHPTEKFQVGDQVRVVVCKLEREKERITLGLAVGV